MRLARTIAPLLGLLLVAALASPAGARTHAASNQALFSAGLIAASDVPAGWTPSKQSDNALKAYRPIPDCKQFVVAANAIRKGAARKLSPTFTDDASPRQLAMAQDTVFAFKSAGAASKAFTALKAVPAGNCLAKVAVSAVRGPSRSSVTDVSSQVQGVGDDSFAYEITLHATDQSGPVTAVFDVVGVRVGRAIVNIDFGNQDTTLPQASAIVNAVVGRMTNA
jgi:hypothetical protein